MNLFAFVRHLLVATLAATAVAAAHAVQPVRVPEVDLTFDLPDAWVAGPPPARAPKMDTSDPLALRWRGAAVPGRNGVPVAPGMNLFAFNVPDGFDVVPYSATIMARRGWPFKAFLSREKDGPQLPFSTGYLTEFSRDGVTMRMLVVHAVHQGKFMEITLSATDDVFPAVEAELRAVLLSVRPAP